MLALVVSKRLGRRGSIITVTAYLSWPIAKQQSVFSHFLRTEKYFRNFIKSTRNQILFTIFRLIWNQTKVRLVPNQSVNGKYNLISGWSNKISKIFLCVQIHACDRFAVTHSSAESEWGADTPGGHPYGGHCAPGYRGAHARLHVCIRNRGKILIKDHMILNQFDGNKKQTN